MTGGWLALSAVLALAACEDGTYRGTTDERRITRDGDRGQRILARPVPGGCLYSALYGLAFAPFPCPPDAAGWIRPSTDPAP
jgi:hypothetical protein